MDGDQTSPSLIEVAALTHRYWKQFALAKSALHIREMLGIIGPNGARKMTLLISKWQSPARQYKKAPRPIHSGELIVRGLAIALVLCGLSATSTAAWAQTECKVCRETLGYCLKAHSKDACNHDYAVCMKACRKK